MKTKELQKEKKGSKVKSFFGKLGKDFKANKVPYLMILPTIIFVILFAYVPMYGLLMAFVDYNPSLGIMGSPWVGLKYFERFFRGIYALRTIKNTFLISFFSLIIGFPMPIIFALLLNQIGAKRFSKFLQMISYAPYFISVVVVCEMFKTFLAPDSGILTRFIALFGGDISTDYLGNPANFRPIYLTMDIWQNLGWSSIIYISTLSSVDPCLYDAAKIDGASKLALLRHIDWPSLKPTIIVLLILSSGNILNVGFEKVFLMQNDSNLAGSEIISTYIYKKGLMANQYGLGTAVGLLNSVISFILLTTVNIISRKISGESLW